MEKLEQAKKNQEVMMIRKVILGTILVGMVAGPLCAAQVAMRAARVGAHANRVAGRVQSAVGRRMPIAAPAIPQATSPVTPAIAALSMVKPKQQSQGDWKSSWAPWIKGALWGVSGVLWGNLILDRHPLLSRALVENEIISCKQFQKLPKTAQKAYIHSLLSGNYLSDEVSDFLSQVLQNDVSEEIKSIIKEYFVKNYENRPLSVFPPNKLFATMLAPDEEKIVKAVKDVLERVHENNGHRESRLNFLDECLNNGSEQVKILIRNYIGDNVDSFYRENHAYRRVSYNNIHSIVIKAFQLDSSDEAQQISRIDRILKSHKRSFITKFFYSSSYLSDVSLDYISLYHWIKNGSETIQKYIAENFDFTDISYWTSSLSSESFQFLNKAKQIEIITALLNKQNFSREEDLFIDFIYIGGSKEIQQIIGESIDYLNLSSFRLLNIALKYFTQLEKAKQAEIITTLLNNQNRFYTETYFLNGVYYRGSKEIQQMIGASIDYLNLSGLSSDLLDVAVQHFIQLEKAKQAEIITTFLNKQDYSDAEKSFLKNVYERGSEEVQHIIWENVGGDMFRYAGDVETPTYISAQKHALSRITYYQSLPDPLKELVRKMAQYQAEEMKKGRVVIFNGQQSDRGLYESLAKKLYEHVNKVTVNPGAAMPRYFKKDTISADLRTSLCRQERDSRNHRKDLIFGNVDGLGNTDNPGSCTVGYLRDNSDMGHGNLDSIIEELFSEYGFKKEFEQIIKDDPTIIKRLMEIQRQISNFGELTSFSIPLGIASTDEWVHRKVHQNIEDYGLWEEKLPSFVDDYVYPAQPGGGHCEYAGMSKVSDIVGRMKEMPSSHEYCIPAGEEMADPALAQLHGLIMKKWIVEPNVKAMQKRDALIDEIIAKCVAMQEGKA